MMALSVSEHRAAVDAAIKSPKDRALADAAEALAEASKCFLPSGGEVWWHFISATRSARAALGVDRDRADDWGDV